VAGGVSQLSNMLITNKGSKIMAIKIVYPNGDYSKNTAIGSVSMSSRGIMVKDDNSSMLTNIVESNLEKKLIIRSELEKVLDSAMSGGNYHPDWEKCFSKIDNADLQ
jgi:hypothetical protein